MCAVRILRRAAAIANGLCVLALLALLIPASLLWVAGLLQDTSGPQLLGWRFYCVADDALAPALSEGDLALFFAQEEYPDGTPVLCLADTRVRCGRLVADGSGTVTLQDAGGQTLESGLPPHRVLGALRARLPAVGRWLNWAMTPAGLCCLVLAGVFLAELPAFLRPRNEGRALKKRRFRRPYRKKHRAAPPPTETFRRV